MNLLLFCIFAQSLLIASIGAALVLIFSITGIVRGQLRRSSSNGEI